MTPYLSNTTLVTTFCVFLLSGQGVFSQGIFWGAGIGSKVAQAEVRGAAMSAEAKAATKTMAWGFGTAEAEAQAAAANAARTKALQMEAKALAAAERGALRPAVLQAERGTVQQGVGQAERGALRPAVLQAERGTVQQGVGQAGRQAAQEGVVQAEARTPKALESLHKRGVELQIERPPILDDPTLTRQAQIRLEREFNSKIEAMQNAARRGELVWKPGTKDTRLPALQSKYRKKVADRYKRLYGQKLDLHWLDADHPVDLIAGGTTDQTLKLRHSAINRSIGSSLRRAGEQAGLKPGDQISGVHAAVPFFPELP